MGEGGYIGTDLFNDARGIMCYPIDQFTDLPCSVESYIITVVDSAHSSKDYFINGPAIPEGIKLEIQKLGENISVTAHEFTVRQGCEKASRKLIQTLKLN
jgi:hypothetical protein